MKTKKKLWPLSLVLAGTIIILTACHKNDDGDDNNNTGDEKGYVTGVVTDTMISSYGTG